LDADSLVSTTRAELLDEIDQTAAAAAAVTPSSVVVTVSPEETKTNLPNPTESNIPLTAKPLSRETHDCLPSQEFETAEVSSVIDGDTIRVIIEGQSTLIRYIGIDAPDAPNTGPSKTANIELVSGQTVFLYRDQNDTDPFDRLLRYVFVGDVFVNYELVAQGMATSERFPPDTACNNYFDQAQAAAQAADLGIWVPAPASSPQIEIIRVHKHDEYVDIRNNGSEAQSLVGWELVSERGNQRCFLSGSIDAGATLRIWADSGHEEGLNCGFGTPIWNNSQSDPAIIYDENDVQIDRYP
jgi:micrococcal nuclease